VWLKRVKRVDELVWSGVSCSEYLRCIDTVLEVFCAENLLSFICEKYNVVNSYVHLIA